MYVLAHLRACRLRGLGAAEPKQARFLRRRALMLSEALLGSMEESLVAAERDAGALAGLSSLREAPQQPAAAMAVEGLEGAVQAAASGAAAARGAGGGGAQQQQQEQGQGQGQQQPALPDEAGARASPAPAGQDELPHPPAQTPAVAAAGGRGAASRAGTPGTDLRALLGTPGALPSAEQQQVVERSVALLQLAYSFQKDIARWLQVGWFQWVG